MDWRRSHNDIDERGILQKAKNTIFFVMQSGSDTTYTESAIGDD